MRQDKLLVIIYILLQHHAHKLLFQNKFYSSMMCFSVAQKMLNQYLFTQKITLYTCEHVDLGIHTCAPMLLNGKEQNRLSVNMYYWDILNKKSLCASVLMYTNLCWKVLATQIEHSSEICFLLQQLV